MTSHYNRRKFQEDQTEEPTVEMNNKAYSMYKDDTTNEWIVAEITFNAQADKLGTLRVVHRDLDRSLAHERFRIIVAENLF